MTERFCPACRRPSASFEPVGNRLEARCPSCQAVERHRLLALLLDASEPFVAPGTRVLEVAPSPILRRILTERFGETRYVGIDIAAHRLVDALADLTRLPFADASFDLVVCSHVLEHVDDDRAAMRELARITAPGGLVVVLVPHRPDRPTDDGPLLPGETNEERFGQDDHVRWYGADVDARLVEEGLQPLVLTAADLLTEDEVERYRLDPEERVWLCAPLRPHPVPADGLVGDLLRGRIGLLRELGLLAPEPGRRLRDPGTLRERAEQSFELEREAGELRRAVADLTRERDALRTRAEHAETMYRQLAAHPVVRALRTLKQRVDRR